MLSVHSKVPALNWELEELSAGTAWVLHCSWLPVKNKLRVARQHHLQTLLLPRLLDPTTGCRTNYTDTKLMKRQRNKCGWFCWIYKGFSIKLETTLGSDMELHGCKMFLHTLNDASGLTHTAVDPILRLCVHGCISCII